MIKLSLNSPDILKQPAPDFSSALAAAVEAASVAPELPSVAQAAVKKQPKVLRTPPPSSGLLSRGVQWLQQRGRSKKRLHMIETVSLGEKRFVALVKVDGREFLLGGAPSSVGMLADLGAHGLGELLSVAVADEAKVQVTPPAIPEATGAKVEAIATTVPPIKAEADPEATSGEVIEPVTLQLPIPKLAAVPQNIPVPAAVLNITVEADEDEADWLQDEMGDALKSATEMEPTSRVASPSAVPQVILQSAPANAIELADKRGPVAVPSPVVPTSADAISNANLNFTFQMWPASVVASSAAHAAAPASSTVGPMPVVSKARKHIDLEACPELLGEPYVLALLDNAQGAAA